MPWKPTDASSKTSRANTPKKKRQWRDIANRVLAKTGDDASAIKQANGVLKRMAGRR